MLDTPSDCLQPTLTNLFTGAYPRRHVGRRTVARLKVRASATEVAAGPKTAEFTDHFYEWKDGYQCHYIRMPGDEVRILTKQDR